MKQRLISGIIEQIGLHGQVRSRNEVVCLDVTMFNIRTSESVMVAYMHKYAKV